MAGRSGFKQPYDLVETLSGKVEEVMKNAVNVAEDMQVGKGDTCTAGDTVFSCYQNGQGMRYACRIQLHVCDRSHQAFSTS